MAVIQALVCFLYFNGESLGFLRFLTPPPPPPSLPPFPFSWLLSRPWCCSGESPQVSASNRLCWSCKALTSSTFEPVLCMAEHSMLPGRLHGCHSLLIPLPPPLSWAQHIQQQSLQHLCSHAGSNGHDMVLTAMQDLFKVTQCSCT